MNPISDSRFRLGVKDTIVTQDFDNNASARPDQSATPAMTRPRFVVWTAFAAFAAFLGGAAMFLAGDRVTSPVAVTGEDRLPLSARQETPASPAVPAPAATPAAPSSDELAMEQGSTDRDADDGVNPAVDELAALEPTDKTPVIEEEPVIQPRLLTVEVKRGATLMSTLLKAGLPRPEAYEVVQGLTKVFDPRRLRAGQEIELTFIPDAEGEESLTSVAMQLDATTSIVAVRTTDDRFVADEVVAELQKSEASAAGIINSSLYVSARDEGLPDAVILELINIYSFDVDFQWEVRQGDRFRVVYEQFHDEEGNLVKTGAIRFAELTLSGDEKPLYLYTDTEGEDGYYNAKGFSARKALLRMPVNGARLSSGFGKRRHPILGYSKMHKGADYAAPKGTPIQAAGNGVIVASGWNGAYGKYIRIRHNDTFHTAYAHMNAIRKGMSKGARVKQGQIIGTVGSTGRSTGPHLHYEVLKHGKQVNPLKVKMPTGRKLKGKELNRFQAQVKDTQDRIASLFAPAEPDQAARPQLSTQRASSSR